MKYIYLFFITTLYTSIAFSQDGSDINVPLTDPESRGLLKIYVHQGSITVIGQDRTDVAVNYDVDNDDHHYKHKNKNKKKYSGLRRIGSPKPGIEITEDNNVVEIECESHNGEVDITIYLPVNFDLDLGNHTNGDISVENINGEVNLESHNGDISATEIKGTVHANTYNGDVEVEMVTIPNPNDMSFGSYNGDIEIILPPDYSTDFKLKTHTGDILSDLELAEVSQKSDLKKSNNGSFKIYTDTWTYVRLNQGGPEVTINSYNGDIIIKGF